MRSQVIVEKGWIPVTNRLPKKIGCYLCISSDGWQMVCFINATGQWMLRPGGSFYGDICGNREITHWRNLPKATIVKEKL